MKHRPIVTFAERLTLARRMVARGAHSLPVNVADQTTAAGREMHLVYDRLKGALPVLEPERHWQQRSDLESTDDVRALLLAGLLGCVRTCIHLRRSGPQPAFRRLQLGRVDCRRCVQTLGRPISDDDECDLCGVIEVDVFTPFAVQRGPLLMTGDACSGCADVLGIVQEAASRLPYCGVWVIFTAMRW